MSQPPLLALDIGSTKVACAVGLPHEQGPGFELVGSSLVSYPTPPEAWLSDAMMVSRTIEQAIEASGASGDAQSALVTFHHPRLTSERVRAALTLADEPIVIRSQDLMRLQRRALDQALGVDREPLLVERLGCSGNGFEGVHDPRGLSATRLVGMFHVIAMPTAARQALVHVVESAGLDLARLIYSLPSALASVWEPAWQQRRVLLIDRGGLTTSLGCFLGSILEAVRVMPRGGITLAAAMARELHVSFDQALAWTLEGSNCRRPEARALVEEEWQMLQRDIEALLQGEARPEAMLVTGRGALADGFVEWLEAINGIPTSLWRPARLHQLGDLPQQMGLGNALGLLELATRASSGFVPGSQPFLNRLLSRTRALLVEYF